MAPGTDANPAYGWISAPPRPLLLLQIGHKAADTAALDLLLQLQGLSTVGAITRPYNFPRSWKILGGPGTPVIRIVVFFDPSFEVFGLATIISAGRCASQNINKIRHFSLIKSPIKWIGLS
jgi:hypothetical protein